MLQWAKIQTVTQQTQVVPCRAGKISAVVYSNGDVSICELHKPLGNLRDKPFWEIWDSEQARTLRASVAAKECHCTTEVFLWSSIVYQPVPLVRTLLSSKAWENAKPLGPGEKIVVPEDNPQAKGSPAPAQPIAISDSELG
jgi:hypothetical protein